MGVTKKQRVFRYKETEEAKAGAATRGRGESVGWG